MQQGNAENLDLPSVVEALMLRHRDKWLRFVRRVVHDPADAEDVLQDAALRMLMRHREFHTTEQARMYLGRIICNAAIELYHTRRRYRRQCRPLHEQLLATSDLGEPEQYLVKREEWNVRVHVLNLLTEGLARLPVKQYEAIRLTVMDSGMMSMRDAGIDNHIPYSTLRHRSVQGLRRLRRFLRRALRTAPAKLVMA